MTSFKTKAEDLTKIKMAEENIIQKEAQLQKIFESMAEGIILWSAQLQSVRINTEIERIFKQDSCELEGQPFKISQWKKRPAWKIIRPDGTARPDEERPAYRVLMEKREIRDIEGGIKWPDGEITWIQANSAPILNSKGDIEGIVTTVTDTTELKKLKDENEYYTLKLIETQEDERNLIARELHDSVLPDIAVMAKFAENIIEKSENLSDIDVQKLKWLIDRAQKVIQNIRNYSYELYPGVLDHFGLIPALDSLLEMLKENSCIQTQLLVSGKGKRLSQEIELELFRIAQESLNNVKNHAGATGVVVTLFFKNGYIKLLVADNGKGFDTQQVQNSSFMGRMGLITMQERARLIGGKMEIKSEIGHGTTISVKVPLEKFKHVSES
jgi:PAS domain S-box-containing protein